MSKLTRDGTGEPVSQDQILRREREQEVLVFPVQLTTSRIGNLTRLTHTLAICVTIHTTIRTTYSIESTYYYKRVTDVRSTYMEHTACLWGITNLPRTGLLATAYINSSSLDEWNVVVNLAVL